MTAAADPTGAPTRHDVDSTIVRLTPEQARVLLEEYLAFRYDEAASQLATAANAGVIDGLLEARAALAEHDRVVDELHAIARGGPDRVAVEFALSAPVLARLARGGLEMSGDRLEHIAKDHEPLENARRMLQEGAAFLGILEQLPPLVVAQRKDGASA